MKLMPPAGLCQWWYAAQQRELRPLTGAWAGSLMTLPLLPLSLGRRLVEELLRRPETVFVLVASPAEERIPDTLFFARKLAERGLRLAAVVINRIHSPVPAQRRKVAPGWAEQRQLLAWLGERDARGVAALKALLGRVPVVELPVLEEEPASLPALAGFADLLAARWPAGH